MARKIIKWVFYISIISFFVIISFIFIVLNPSIFYKSKTTYHKYTIYHNAPLNGTIYNRIDEAEALLKQSEFYNPSIKLDICLNENSNYPLLMEKIQGKAFAWGFYNKVVLSGNADYTKNFLVLNGYKWNLTQLLAHEMTHCLQYDKLGLFKSNPIANIASWKWEGYAEYVARQNSNQVSLLKNISRLIETEKKDKDAWGVEFSDSSMVSKLYYKRWLLVQYYKEIKKWNYFQILKDTTSEDRVNQEMMGWYNQQIKINQVPILLSKLFAERSNLNITTTLNHNYPSQVYLLNKTDKWNIERFKLNLNSGRHTDTPNPYLFLDSSLSNLFSVKEKAFLLAEAQKQKIASLTKFSKEVNLITSFNSIKNGFFFSITQPIYTTDQQYTFVDMSTYYKDATTKTLDQSYYAQSVFIYKYSNDKDWVLVKKLETLIL